MNYRAEHLLTIDERPLKYLSLQGFRDSLSIFAGRDIRRLFLANVSLKSFQELELFPNLETLHLVGLRKGLDLSPIARLPKLLNLAIEGRPILTGWDTFGSETLRTLDLQWAPSRDILDRFPALQTCYIRYKLGERGGFGFGNDEGEIHEPFSFLAPMRPM